VLGCADKVTTDDNETGTIPAPPVAEFDPAARVIPFPNNLLLDPITHKLSLPAQCGEEPGSSAERVRASLNQLDGFATSRGNEPGRSPIAATFSADIDSASLAGRVFLLRLPSRDDAGGPEEIQVSVGRSLRATADCASSMAVPNVTIAPASPLHEASTYAAVLLRGITTSSGSEFEPTATWALTRQTTSPVEIVGSPDAPVVAFNATPFDPQVPADLQRLVGLSQLWKVHAPILGFLDAALPALTARSEPVPRDEILLAWSFNTQTLSAPFDASVSGSPASLLSSDTAPDAPALPDAPLAGEGGLLTVEQFYAAAIPGVSCELLGCAAIGAIYAAPALGAPGPSFLSPNFQSGDDCDASTPTPAGAWDDPLKPHPVCDQRLPFVAVVPNAAAGLRPGPDGYKTVIFAHGLTRSKEDLFALAGQLAAQGIASVAIDAVNHGARAVRSSTDAALGCDESAVGEGLPCATALTPMCAPQCFAPLLSPSLAVTRDNLRQTVLDQQKLERVLEYCATAGACGSLWVDANHIGYVGQSLGALIGSVSVAVSPDIKSAVLNVGGADWVQVFTDSASVGIRCPLLDGLIDAGFLSGKKWEMGLNPDALCLDPLAAWKSSPGFLQFAGTARWMLDPVDGVNYAPVYRATGGPKVLLAEVLGDEVVPNSATEQFAGLLGLMPAAAAVASAVPPQPSAEAALPDSHWLQYETLPAMSKFPGNAYSHGSLLAPAAVPPELMAGISGLLGTALMQADTLTFLVTHL
jgi:dienelactone hydrolase